MIHGLRVAKMSGSGNDFIVVGPEQIPLLPADVASWVRRVCRRGLSLGSDGVLLVERGGPDRVRVRFHNPDGSIAFCGNGTRCAARFAWLQGLAGERMVLETVAGDIPARIHDTRVRLELPAPRDEGEIVLEVGTESVRGRFVIAIVPHFVVQVPETREVPLDRWGPALRRHPRFGPAGTNVDVLAHGPGGVLALRTWERGVEGETLACGSGALAAAFVASLGTGGRTFRVLPASGIPLDVAFDGSRSVLEGDARLICEARLTEEATEGFALP